jgi:hypothetical protein
MLNAFCSEAVSLCNAGGLSRPPGELIDRLTDHFLRVTPLGIGWVHPSCRDLVIEQLRGEPAARQRFLSACGTDDLTLALSHAGGAAGERTLPLPLLIIDTNWDALADRTHDLLRELDDKDIARVLHALTGALSAVTEGPQASEAQTLATDCPEHGKARVEPTVSIDSAVPARGLVRAEPGYRRPADCAGPRADVGRATSGVATAREPGPLRAHAPRNGSRSPNYSATTTLPHSRHSTSTGRTGTSSRERSPRSHAPLPTLTSITWPKALKVVPTTVVLMLVGSYHRAGRRRHHDGRRSEHDDGC